MDTKLLRDYMTDKTTRTNIVLFIYLSTGIGSLSHAFTYIVWASLRQAEKWDILPFILASAFLLVIFVNRFGEKKDQRLGDLPKVTKLVLASRPSAFMPVFLTAVQESWCICSCWPSLSFHGWKGQANILEGVLSIFCIYSQKYIAKVGSF